MPTTSVVITVYNDEQFLAQALKSVYAQSVLPTEIIVVDDGSSKPIDKDALPGRIPNCPRLQIVRKENGGPSSARNYGLTLAIGEYIAFFDVDDKWLPNNLETKLSMINDCSAEYCGVYGSFIPSTTTTPVKFKSFDGTLPRDFIGVRGGFPGGAPSYLFRRRALLSIGGFNEELVCNEDFALILELSKAGWLCKGNSHPGFIRNMRQGSLTRNEDIGRNYQRVSRFLRYAAERRLLSVREIQRRRKLNNLSLAYQLQKSGKPRKAVRDALRKAFKIDSPKNAREVLAYLYYLWLTYCGSKPSNSSDEH